ncbi:MAG: hypothetical protein NC131_13540 [Roseburia sp.]|nr:hypothetical protein [Roseburia sp.]
MEKSKLIERCNKVKEIAGNTVPFHAPQTAPDLVQELLAVKFEAMRTCVSEDHDFIEAFDVAKQSLDNLVKYYGNYFFK